MVNDVGRGTYSRYAPSDVGRKMQLHLSVSGRPSEQSGRTSHVHTEVE
jgi:hypothetical protein